VSLKLFVAIAMNHADLHVDMYSSHIHVIWYILCQQFKWDICELN